MRLPSDFDGIPAYGVLTLVEERYWYDHYRYCWYLYICDHMRKRFADEDDAFINEAWPYLPHEYKATVWALMSAEERERIRNVRANR